MHFIWPQALAALVLMPVLVWLYVWMLRRRKVAIAYPSLLVLRQALGGSPRWRRHVPPALLGIAAAVAIIGVARPVMSIVLPADYMTLVLAMDVSRSMLAEDVEPNRIQAAQASVRDFLKQLPSDVRVGIVSFAATAQLVQPVTDNREDLVNAIDRFELLRGTATGSGLLLALATLLPDSGINLEQIIYGEDFGRWGASPLRPKKESAPKAPAQKAVPPGSYSNGAIVLLSDGRRTHGPDVAEAAREAARRGVRVYTVAFGTANGFIPGFEGSNYWTRVDEQSLRAIAAMTEAEFFRAGNSDDLKQVYEHLSSKFSMERRYTEVSALFAAAAAAMLLAAVVLSLVWFPRR